MPEKRKVELKPVDALSPAAVELRSENLLAMGSVTFHLSDNSVSYTHLTLPTTPYV